MRIAPFVNSRFVGHHYSFVLMAREKQSTKFDFSQNTYRRTLFRRCLIKFGGINIECVCINSIICKYAPLLFPL